MKINAFNTINYNIRGRLFDGSHFEAHGRPPSTQGPGGPIAVLCAHRGSSLFGLVGRPESPCGRREPPAQLPSRHSTAAGRRESRVIVCVFLCLIQNLISFFVVHFTSWAGILLETSRRRSGQGWWTWWAEVGGTRLQVDGDKARLV